MSHRLLFWRRDESSHPSVNLARACLCICPCVVRYFYKQNFFDWELWVKWLLCCGVFLGVGVLFLSGYILQVMSGSSISAWMHNPGNL